MSTHLEKVKVALRLNFEPEHIQTRIDKIQKEIKDSIAADLKRLKYEPLKKYIDFHEYQIERDQMSQRLRKELDLSYDGYADGKHYHWQLKNNARLLAFGIENVSTKKEVRFSVRGEHYSERVHHDYSQFFNKIGIGFKVIKYIKKSWRTIIVPSDDESAKYMLALVELGNEFKRYEEELRNKEREADGQRQSGN